MQLHRHVLSALVLSLALPVLAPGSVGAAHADRGNRLIYADIGQSGSTYLTWKPRVVIASGGDDVATVVVELESERGEEELPLVASDTWLHGSAKIGALPAADAALTVTVYDTGSAALISFSGTLGADGAVTLAADDTATGGACTSRVGCADGGTRADAPDIEVLAAELFAGAGSYDLGLDLAGADTFDVAYASVTVTEPGAQTCLATDEKGNCLKWATTDAVSTRAEVYWDDIGTVWTADAALALEGLVEITAKAYDADGRKLETANATLGVPWLDDGAGVSTLATDEDPLTRLALTKGGRHLGCLQSWHAQCPTQLTVVSDGWSTADELPIHAEVELTDGDTITIPVNSYQRTSQPRKYWSVYCAREYSWSGFATTNRGGGLRFDDVSAAELRAPVCSEDTCVTLVDNEDGTCGLSFTAYGPDAGSLPDSLEMQYVVRDDNVVVDELDDDVTAEERTVVFDDTITAVFANELRFAGDPSGLGLSGLVKLLGAPNRGGNGDTLTRGRFYGSFSRDTDGDLSLSGGDEDAVVSGGAVVLPGEAVLLTDREGTPAAPPAIQYANGSGTKNATTTTSTRPQLF